MMKSAMLMLLAAVVAVVSAQPAPPKCCFANQFEIQAGQLVGVVAGGKGIPMGQSIKMAFDYTNKQLGEITTTYAAGQSYMYRVIIDYNKGVQYVIEEKTRTCEKVPSPETNMTHCIPDNAKFLETFFMGNDQITANSFSYPLTEPSTGDATLAVTKTDCIPVSASFVGTSAGTEVIVGTQYKNYTSGIKDPSTYFNVPSYCPKTVSKIKKEKMFKHHLNLLYL